MMVEIRQAANGVSGTIRVPGDKSISHRAAILGALAFGTTEITGYASGLDCASTLSCLEKLGVLMERPGQDTVVIHGNGPGSLKQPHDILDAGNSGTTMRLLGGVLASLPFCSAITGDPSLRSRPMDRIINPLREMGARIYGRQGGHYAPLTVIGGNLRGISHLSQTASAQVKSAILLAGLGASGYTTVKEPFLSRDHTEHMLRYLGAKISTRGLANTMAGGTRLSGKRIPVPGDISSAAYFAALAALIPESELTIENTGINPTRTGFLRVMHSMGADISFTGPAGYGFEPVASITVRSSRLTAVDVGPKEIPALIDEVPILAVLATQAKGITRISGAQELRVKESDRLAAITNELQKMGACIQETGDGLIIKGPSSLSNAGVESHGDHRIAMALGLAGCLAEGTTVIAGARCTEISFPGFWNVLSRLAPLTVRESARPRHCTVGPANRRDIIDFEVPENLRSC